MIAKAVEKKPVWQYVGYVPTWIVGIQYCDKAAKTGEQLYLEPEPENPVDPLAMAVFSSCGKRVGYLPRYDAAVFTPAVNRGCVLLKARAESTENEYKTSLRLEVYATEKADSWFKPRLGDSLLDILHNSMLSVWCGQEIYSYDTIMEFDSTMKERVNRRELYIETIILYRLLRGVCLDKIMTENFAIFNLLENTFSPDNLGTPIGCRDLAVYPVFGDINKMSGNNANADAPIMPEHLEFSPGNIVEYYPYPEHAQGMVICYGSLQHRICWFDSPAEMQKRWFELITKAKNDIPNCVSGKPVSRKNIVKGIVDGLQKSSFASAPNTPDMKLIAFIGEFQGDLHVKKDGKLIKADLIKKTC